MYKTMEYKIILEDFKMIHTNKLNRLQQLQLDYELNKAAKKQQQDKKHRIIDIFLLILLTQTILYLLFIA